MKVLTFICVHAWEKKYPCKNEFVWNGHIQVMLKLISFSIFQGSKCSQTLYLCLVTGRIFFYLSPPTSKLNNNLNIYFPFFSDNKIVLNIFPSSNDNHRRPSFHFSLNLNTRTLLRFVVGAAKFSSTWTSSTSASLALFRFSRKRSPSLSDYSVSIDEEAKQVIWHLLSRHAHYKDCIISFLLSRVW